MKKVLKELFGNEGVRIVFVHSCTMFLTTPSPEELQQFELPELMDMLAKHTTEYIQIFKEQGSTSHTAALREMVINIQVAIDHKKASGMLPPDNADGTSSLSQ